MGDSVVVLNTNTSIGASVDTRTNTGGEHRQVVVIGEGAATSDAVIPGDATNGLLVNPSDRAARDNGKVDISAFDVALPTGTNHIGSVSINSAGSIAITLASSGPLTVIQPTQGYLNATVFQPTGSSLHVQNDAGTAWMGHVALVSNTSVGVTGNIQLASAGSLAITLASGGPLTVIQPTPGYLNATVSQATGSNLHVVNDAGTSWMGHVALASGTTVAITLSSSGSLEVRQPTQGYLNATVFQSTATNLKVDASGVAVPVTDNSGSLTIDAPLATPVFVTPTPSTTGGWSPIIITGLFLGSQGIIKGSAGTLGGYYIYNPNAAVAYCQIFDTVVAATVGTTTPKLTLGIPATSGANVEYTNGVNFALGIRCAATTTASGSTVNTSGLDCTFLFK